MFPEAILLAIAVGLIRGGRVPDRPPARCLWLPPLAAGLQLALWFLPGPRGALPLVLLSTVLLLLFVYLNRSQAGLRLVGLGFALNLAVMLANGGRMPVDAAALAALGHDPARLVAGQTAKHQPLDANTRLAFLADVIPVPHPLRPRLISVGDAMALVGTFLAVQHWMLANPRSRGAGAC